MAVRGTFPGLGPDDDTPVYVISVAARLTGMHAQTLRQYDRLGLVTPSRTHGGGRRYSARDVTVLREIQRLSQEEGVSLAGVARILELENDVLVLRARRATHCGGRASAGVGRVRVEIVLGVLDRGDVCRASRRAPAPPSLPGARPVAPNPLTTPPPCAPSDSRPDPRMAQTRRARWPGSTI